jgi:DNA-binding FadR family transcriptional regulator
LRAVAEAIAAHDPDRARDAMCRHVDRFGALYIEVDERRDQPPSPLR